MEDETIEKLVRRKIQKAGDGNLWSDKFEAFVLFNWRRGMQIGLIG